MSSKYVDRDDLEEKDGNHFKLSNATGGSNRNPENRIIDTIPFRLSPVLDFEVSVSNLRDLSLSHASAAVACVVIDGKHGRPRLVEKGQ